MLDTRTPQRMIQFSAPAPAATPASPSTVAPGAAGALAKAPENRQFSEVLGATEDAAAPAGADVPDLALAAAADGKIGKRPGKILPEAMEPASALPDPAEAPASDMPEPLAAPLPDTGGAAAAMLPVILPIAAFTAAAIPAIPITASRTPKDGAAPIAPQHPAASAMVPAAAQPAPAAAKGLAAALSTPAADAAQFRLIAITAGEADSGDAPPPAQPFPVSTTLLGRVQGQAPKIASPVPPAAAVTEAPTSPSAAMPGPANAIASATDPEPPLASSTRQPAEADMESAVEVPKTGATSLSREQFPAPLAITVTGTGTVPSADTGSPRTASAAPVAEGPQDFAALVGRLAQAREAADPQRVRAALSHAQFGAVSLEFRHEDRGLSVTMASASAGFTGSVQAAVAATLASGQTGDPPRDTGQQTAQNAPQNPAFAGGSGGQTPDQRQQASAADARAGQEQSRRHGAHHEQRPGEAPEQRSDDGGRGGIYA
ncbi:MAG: hypothetical protein E2586_09615 [Novosphingobium sp.]|uniref:hypothetical protein n=1 Tax=Novosphingobium sp. TaxID=1874826 RepID=UPI0012C8D76C|nr:hypothetical protein [Novosphingobium sp.]MPS68742.1 hypothetical protein [Novosphingobium sp.]